MTATKGRPIEYRDTFEFRIFPDYTYTATQKLRVRLFQGRIEHWRAAVNYADRFAAPQNINLLYMIGYTPKLKDYLERNTNTNLVVLCAPFTKEDLDIYDNFWNLVKRYKPAGLVDKDGKFSSDFYETGRKNIQHRDSYDLAKEIALEYESHFALIESYEKLKERGIGYFSRMIMVDKLHAERTVSFSDLDKIIKSYFPYGRERIGMSDKAIRSPKKILDALQTGLHRESAAKIFGLPNDTDTYTLCKKEIKRCKMDISVPIRNTGVADLVAIFRKMQAPPYGWDNDIHTAYCFGYAVSEFLDNAWIWDTINVFPARETAQSVLGSIIRMKLGRRHTFILTTESGKKLSNRFAYLFNIGTMVPKDAVDERILELSKLGFSERKIAEQLQTISNVAVHKRLVRMRTSTEQNMPFADMTKWICKRIEEKTRWPISVIDSRLQQTICGTYDPEHYVSTPLLDRASIRDALKYFTEERCREIKAKLERIDTYVPELIRERYGNDVNVDDIYKYCTTECSGWLWEPDIFWDSVNNHINHIGMHYRQDGWYYNDNKLPETSS